MRVTSPVGDFPFTPQKVRIEGTSVVLDGAMGAWPATVRVEPRDVPELVRAIPPAVVAGVAVAIGALIIGWSRSK